METIKTFFATNKKAISKGILIAAGVVGAIITVGVVKRKGELNEEQFELLEEHEETDDETPEE